MPDDDPACIERVLSFLYLHDYEETGHTLSLATLGRGLSTLNQTKPAQKRKFSAIQDEPATDTVPAEHISPNTVVSANSSPETVTPEDDSSEVEIIFNNIDVYLAADKFGITDLQALAASRVCAWLSTNVQSKVFLSAAMKIMKFKLPNDMTLKDNLAEVMSKNLSVLLPEDDFLPILDEFGCLGSAILQKYRGKQLFAMEVLRFGAACGSCRPFKGGYLEEKPGQLRVCCKRCHSPLHGGVL